MSTAVMIDELMRILQADQRAAGEPVRAGATPAQLAHVRREARAALGVELPPAYADFLRVSNGLDYNGLVIYDCASSPASPTDGFWQGLVAANVLWREDPALRPLLVVGDSDMDLYAWNPATGDWLRVDRIAHDRARGYRSFEALLEDALEARM